MRPLPASPPVVARLPVILVAVAAAAATATVLVTALRSVSFAYRSIPTHTAIETVASLTALLAAYLVAGRFRRTQRLDDLVLTAALALLALANLAFAVGPALVTFDPPSFSTWTAVASRSLAAALFAAAALAPRRSLLRPQRSLALAAAAIAAALVAIGVAVAVSADALPLGIDPGLSPEDSSGARVVGHPGVLVAQLAVMALFAVAAAGFARRARVTGDELLGWLAIGAVVAAFARLNYFLFPSLYSEWVYTGDVFRATFCVLLLVGALREIGSYQRSVADVAVSEERRRLARDIHDGLAQDLAFLVSRSRHLARQPQAPAGADLLAEAAERALDESRTAIAALTRGPDEPLAVAVRRTAEEVALRAGVTLDLDLADDVRVPAATREALARIVREAVTNAVRHGAARRVTIELRRDRGACLRVRDDGRGFDPTSPERAGSFGLTSMRERAEALGGRLHVRSEMGAGTELEVRLR